jgi:hypothetical protein
MAGSVRFAEIALVLAIFFAIAIPTSAGPEPPTDLATAYNTQRKIVRTPDGTLFAAVTVNASGTPQVRVLRSPDGGAWTALPAPSAGDGWSDRSTLALDSRGHIHLAWTEPTVPDRQVFYARFDGSSWTPSEQLSSSPGYAGFPSIAVDASDRAHVVWYGFDGTFYQVYYRRLEPVGWTEERALTHEAVDATNPAIALGPDHSVHIAWFRAHRDETYNEVAYLHLSGDEVRETATISSPAINSLDPSLVVDRGGVVHVVWTAFLGGVSRIQYVRRDGTWSAPAEVSPAGMGGRHATLAVDLAARLYVAWEGLDGQIYVQLRGTSWIGPEALTSAGRNRYPSLRWSQDFNPLCGPNDAIDVIWTVEEAGSARLAHDTVDASPCESIPDSGLDLRAVAIVSLIASVASVAGFAVWLRRRWYPRPPAAP